MMYQNDIKIRGNYAVVSVITQEGDAELPLKVQEFRCQSFKSQGLVYAIQYFIS